MAYENSHLFAAEQIRRSIDTPQIQELIATNIYHYYLGAVFPDILYFGRDRETSEIANFLHGSSRTPPNKVVLEVIDRIKKAGDQKNLAFILGYLTHCAIDITIHPVVFYFSGYKANGNAEDQKRSAYLHWHYETYIDKRINDEFYLEKMVKPDIVKDLLITQIINIPEAVIREALKRQINYFSRIHNRFYFEALRLLEKMDRIEKKYVAGFYENLRVEKIRLPEEIKYKDIISGEERETNLDKLLADGIEMGRQMIESAFEYFSGKIDKTECEKIVVANNLDTGQIRKTKADIRFSI